MGVRTADILKWLDERGWPHDPHAQTKEQNSEMREALRICGARNRRQLPCGNPPLANGRCKFHKGKVPRGIAAPGYKHGRYSKYLPGARRGIFQEVLADQNLLALDESIAAVDVRMIELLQSLGDEGDPGDLWRRAAKAWDSLWAATARGDKNAVSKYRQELDDILKRGNREIETWEEIRETTDLRRRLVETEMKRREKMRYMILAEDAMADYRALAMTVREAILTAEIPIEVKNALLARIQDGLEAVFKIAAIAGAGTDRD